MSKEKCKHEEWNPCGNNFYSCRQCGILRTSQQVNIYAEKDKRISELEKQLADAEHEIENYQHELEVYKHNDNIYSNSIIKLNNNAKRNKIDFAVAELEKLKTWCQGNAIQVFYNECQTEIKEKHIVIDRPQENGSPSLIKRIDQQINALRGGKNG